VKDSVESRAVEFVTRYFIGKGYNIENVARVRGSHAGYDLLATNGPERLRLEVKGCTRPYGIPDPYISEFDKNTRRLVADILCVVYMLPDCEPELALIPRDAIPPEYVVMKYGYRISGKFKNERTIRKFIVSAK